jgi:pheromone shutdown protein TraB
VDERNDYMCKNIRHILEERADTLVVVVGMGHVEGMKRILDGMGIDVEVV